MTKEEKDLIIEITGIINKDYSNTTFTSQLREMFSNKDDAIASYVKPDREFWHYDGNKGCYRKLTITYVRSGVMFFIFNDEPEKEHAWFLGSFNCLSMYAAQIFPYEIGKLLSNLYEGAETNIPEMCKQCKWDDCNGNINVEVIWD